MHWNSGATSVNVRYSAAYPTGRKRILVAKMIVENYRHWLGKPNQTDETESSVLFDTVAVYLAYTHDNLVMKTVNIEIDDGGVMRLDTPKGKPVQAAIDWVDLGAYEEYLVKRLTK